MARRMMTDQRSEIDFLLEQRHDRMMRWFEPWEAMTAEGEEVNAHIQLRASVHDCINMRRAQLEKKMHSKQPYDDKDLLQDFIAVHWAEVLY